MNKKDFDINKMSQETGISIDVIKQKLGILLEVEKVSTIEEAVEAYNSTPSDSEVETLALKKIANFYGFSE